MDSVGRRPLLLWGVSGLVLSLLALSGAQSLAKGDVATWVSVAGLLTYTASYQVRLWTTLTQIKSHGDDDQQPSQG